MASSPKFVPKRFSVEDLMRADHDMGGFCLACGEEADMVEPDARKYKCESCDERQVYGASEIAIMGLFK